MILDCQASICLVNENVRFTNALVAIGRQGSKTFFMVVNRASSCDKFKLELGNVRLKNSTFEFRQPSKMIHLRDFDPNKFKQFRFFVGHILSKNYKETLKLPKLEKITNLKPKIKSFSMDSSKSISNKNLDWSVLRQFSLEKQNIIPKQIFNQKNVLTHLTLTECSLLSIPPAIRNLQKTLQFLNLSKNNILVIPIWFCKSFKNLQHLDLSHNRLQIIPQDMIFLDECQSLFLNSNNIRFIHDRFLTSILRGSTKFSLINLSNNKLTYLKLQHLEIRPETQIDLSYNQFSSGKKMIENLKHHLQTKFSLKDIALKAIIKIPQLFSALFDENRISFPIYFSFQNQSFICEDCKQLLIHSYGDDHFCRRFPFKNCPPPPNIAYTPDIRHLTYLIVKCFDCFKKNAKCICDPDIVSLEY